MNPWDLVIFVLFDPRPDVVMFAVTLALSIGALITGLLDWAVARTTRRPQRDGPR